MKRFVLFFVLICALFSCTQSGGGVTPSQYEQNGRLKVLSTTAMIDDLVGAIGQDRIDHIPLIVGQMDPHSYELVKGDDEKVGLAALVFANGLNLEHGASLRHQLKVHPNVVFLGDEIKRRVPSQILSVDGEVDPHVWMDVSLWSKGIDPIVSALSRLDPENALFYQRNGDILRQQMLLVDLEIKAMLKKIPAKKRYLVTSHDAFHYFTKAYLAQGADPVNRCVAPEGLAPEGQLSHQDIQRVIDHLLCYGVEVVFPESNMSRAALKKIVSSCEHKGLKVKICDRPLYGDAMGGVGSGADTYLNMIQYNACVLAEEWGE